MLDAIIGVIVSRGGQEFSSHELQKAQINQARKLRDRTSYAFQGDYAYRVSTSRTRRGQGADSGTHVTNK